MLLSDGRKANHCIIYEPLPPPPWTICQFLAWLRVSLFPLLVPLPLFFLSFLEDKRDVCFHPTQVIQRPFFLSFFSLSRKREGLDLERRVNFCRNCCFFPLFLFLFLLFLINDIRIDIQQKRKCIQSFILTRIITVYLKSF